MSSPPRLSCKINTGVVLIVGHEGSGHATPASQFAISFVQTGFELSPRSSVKLIVLSFVVNHSSLVVLLISTFSFIFHEIVTEKVDSILIFSHLICIFNITNEIIVLVNFVVHFLVTRKDGWG